MGVRTCIGCRGRGPEAGWTRIAAPRTGPLLLGRTAPGRGAWCCSVGCFEVAVKRKALERALRREVSSTEVAAVRATLESLEIEQNK